MKNIKDNKGITLITLVITMMIISILAGVTIVMISGENGIINKTKEAKIRAEIAQIKESAEMAELQETEFVIEGEYADKLVYGGNGIFLYNPDYASDIEMKVCNSENMMDWFDLYSYSKTNNYGGAWEYTVNGFSEEGKKLVEQGLNKLVIPARDKEGNEIVYIGEDAFKEEQGIKELKLSKILRKIDNHAFQNCKNLIKVEGETRTFGTGAFEGCEKLESVYLENYTSISAYCFNNCVSLKNIDFPNTMTSIGENAFSGCKSLEILNLPESISAIGFCAFAYCTSLKEVTIPKSLTTMGASCFYDIYSSSTMLYIYLPFTATEGAPEGWNTRWNRKINSIVYYSDGTEVDKDNKGN